LRRQLPLGMRCRFFRRLKQPHFTPSPPPTPLWDAARRFCGNGTRRQGVDSFAAAERAGRRRIGKVKGVGMCEGMCQWDCVPRGSVLSLIFCYGAPTHMAVFVIVIFLSVRYGICKKFYLSTSAGHLSLHGYCPCAKSLTVPEEAAFPENCLSWTIQSATSSNDLYLSPVTNVRCSCDHVLVNHTLYVSKMSTAFGARDAKQWANNIELTAFEKPRPGGSVQR